MKVFWYFASFMTNCIPDEIVESIIMITKNLCLLQSQSGSTAKSLGSSGYLAYHSWTEVERGYMCETAELSV
jgi:hypothetical protein